MHPPQEQRNDIIKEAHASVTGGHKGNTKTFYKLKQKYFWNGMKDDIQRYIQRCRDCQIKKLVRVKTKQKLIITDTPPTPFYKIALDIVGPLPITQKGNEYILTMQCLFSKYTIAVPLPNQTALSIADAFIKKCICVFGTPNAILTDQGSNFLSKFIKIIANKFKIKQFKTTAFHPMSNGSLERSHASLTEYLKMYTNKENQWDEWIELATFNFNTNRHEATKHTPFELVFGRTARLPASDTIEHNDLIPTYTKYLENLITQLNNLHEIAHDKLIQAKLRAKRYYDQKSNHKTIKIGDSVWLLKGPKGHKFDNQYSGPFLVLNTWENGNVKIQINNAQSKIVHSNRLRFSHIPHEQHNINI